MRQVCGLRAGVLAGLLALSVPGQSDEASPSLAEAFAPHFLIGVAVNNEQLRGQDPFGLALVRQEFNALTPENDLKWERVEPEEGVFDFEAGDALADLAKAMGAEITGHTLVWHSQTPDWVFKGPDGGPASRELLLSRMERHINAVVGRYRGRIEEWDVVNEALNEDGSLRDSPWRRIIGDDYIAIAFRLAHAADPDARLVYNDYNLFKPGKREGVVRLVRSLQEQGVPIHGVGLQGHYSLGYPERLEDIGDSIAAFAALGVDVMLTEWDVSVLPFPEEAHQGADVNQDLALNSRYNPFPDGLADAESQAQAEHYATVLAMLLEHAEALTRVTFWGVSDAHSWRNDWPMQGRTDYPLWFDRAGARKPMVDRFLEQAAQSR